MNLPAVLPVLIIATSMLVGLIIFALPEQRTGLRSTLNLTGAVVKLALVIVMLLGVFRGQHYQSELPLVPGIDLVLRVDPISLLFVTLSSVLWLLTTIYAIGYLEGSPHRSRFFGFFSLCVAATAGVALSGNLLTFLLFYELLTLATYPLVVHRGSETARRAGQVYLAYTLGGGVLLLIGTVWLYSLTGDVTFTLGGLGDSLQGQSSPALIMIFVLLIAGLGVKAALVPFHSWLPQAMVAPAPVSALLHAVAVVKAGAFGIVLVLYEIFGIEFAAELGVTTPLMVLAAITILYGSLRALSQDDLKRRLAFSTVSQVSYIALGVTILGPLAIVGGLVHLVHQGLMKVTLFFCAGNLAETLGIHKI
ncbi:MAG: proton-conducting transporter membrane subunit, partial [Thiohalophilus sp.]|uniref:complex I subunit 5 family protein n=1 Tax=Thiohalophilus sp. TaxID=3028392 RepID=UPI00286FB928